MQMIVHLLLLHAYLLYHLVLFLNNILIDPCCDLLFNEFSCVYNMNPYAILNTICTDSEEGDLNRDVQELLLRQKGLKHF